MSWQFRMKHSTWSELYRELSVLGALNTFRSAVLHHIDMMDTDRRIRWNSRLAELNRLVERWVDEDLVAVEDA